MTARAAFDRFSACALLLLCFACGHAQAPSRIATLLDDLDKTQHVGPVALALDRTKGHRTLAFVSNYALTLQSLDGAGGVTIGSRETPVICPGSKAPQPQITALTPSPDGLHFGVLATCGRSTGVYMVDLAGKPSVRRLVEVHGFAEALEYAPDGKHLAMLYVEGASRPSGALAAMKPPSGVIGVEGLEIQRVATINAASGKLEQITPSKLHVYEFDWSPDSSQLAFIAAAPPGENNWWVAKLYTQPATGGEPKQVLDPVTVEGSLHGLQIAVPRWSPDSKQIAFIGGLMSDQGATGGDIYMVPSAGGQPINLTPNQQASAVWIDPTFPGIYTAVANGVSQVRSISLLGGSSPNTAKTRLLFELPASIGDGRLEMSIAEQSGDFAFVKSSYDAPPEVWLAEDELGECPDGCYKFEQVTHLNDALKPTWGKTGSIEWSNPRAPGDTTDQFHVQGWLFYPAGYDPSRRYPLIVMVHGGPSSAVIPRWPGAGFGAAPFSAMGYFVLEPNPRGSYGEGEAFTQANRRDFGYGDLRDILAGVDAVEKKLPIDDKRIGLTGWSYGGFMTMFDITQTQRFRAAVAGAGISNWQSYYGENSIDQWMLPFFGASVYDDPAIYAKSSAITYIKQIKTPTLIVVGDRDGECPAPQSFEFWHALKAQGIDTQLVVYPNEGHGFTDPAHRRDVIERAVNWFDTHMQ